MLVIVGLGNPGERYRDTRHNVGFWVVDELFAEQTKMGTSLAWKRFEQVDMCSVACKPEAWLLLKPLKFMNLSGEAIQPVLHFYKVASEQLVVVHDDVDLPCGQLRVKKGGKAGGHRGVQNIIDTLGTDDFIRLRVGVGRPEQTADNTGAIETKDWVLGKPGFMEKGLLKEAVQKAVQAVAVLTSEGLGAAQNRFNTRVID